MCNACQGIVRSTALLEWNEDVNYDDEQDTDDESPEYFCA